jgi:hypothetical protein
VQPEHALDFHIGELFRLPSLQVHAEELLVSGLHVQFVAVAVHQEVFAVASVDLALAQFQRDLGEGGPAVLDAFRGRPPSGPAGWRV